MASLAIANNPDIRFLGRLLGDVIRAYGGEELFKRIEYIRATSVDRHRGVAGAGAIDSGLDRLSLDETLDFVRGFMIFGIAGEARREGLGVHSRRARLPQPIRLTVFPLFEQPIIGLHDIGRALCAVLGERRFADRRPVVVEPARLTRGRRIERSGCRHWRSRGRRFVRKRREVVSGRGDILGGLGRAGGKREKQRQGQAHGR